MPLHRLIAERLPLVVYGAFRLCVLAVQHREALMYRVLTWPRHLVELLCDFLRVICSLILQADAELDCTPGTDFWRWPRCST